MEYHASSRLMDILNLPNLRMRLYELSIFCEQINIRDLNELFPTLISAIFGLQTDNIGFGLRVSIENTDNFLVLYDFFNPHAAFFRAIYRLINDTATFKFELPINLLPSKLQFMLESGRYSSYYADRLAIDPFQRKVSGLSLNAFDYYMFHFALHGIRNLKVPAAVTINNEKLKSVYFSLSADYLCAFLPGDPNAVILPQIFGATQQSMSPQVIQSIKPTKSPKYLLLSALSPQQPANCIRNITSPSDSPRSWRTETVLHVFIDTFLRFDDGRDLPSNEFIRIVRIMIKQFHDFSNSADIDNTSMRTLRQQAQHCLNARFYPFLKSIIMRWPLDNSFSYVLEMYLSYIQPWRYYFNRNLSKLDTPIVGKYATFVSENLVCYTQIFVRLLTRFQRMDLSSFKNVLMLYRLLKVFGQSNLIEVIKANENAMMAGNSMVSGRSTSFQQNSLDSSHHSSNRQSPNTSLNQSLNLTQQDDSNYVMMTQSDEVSAIVLDLMRRIIGARMKVNDSIQKTEKELHQKFGIFESIVKLIPFLLNFSNVDSSFTASLEENRQVPEILNFALNCFANLYNVDLKELEEEQAVTQSYREEPEFESFLSSTRNESSNFLNITPVVMKSQVSQIQYQGDPDLIPVKTTENTFLVRFLYQLSSALNRMFENHLQIAWNRQDLVGKVTRQLLSPPLEIQVFDKSRGISELKREYLKARISLRFLASHTAIFLVFCACMFGFLFWDSPVLGCLLLFIISSFFVFMRSLFAN